MIFPDFFIIFFYLIGCNNGGGVGNFLKSKAVIFKVHRNIAANTETVISRNFGSPAVWAVRNAVTFCQCILQQDNHIFIFSPAHRLLESAIKLQMRIILGAWRIVWSNFGSILLFAQKGWPGLIFYWT